MNVQSTMRLGVIVKALSGYYYVMPVQTKQSWVASGPIVQCRARGIFRKNGLTPLVGDRVTYSLTSHGEGTIQQLQKRYSQLTRPPIANVRLVVVLFSVKDPVLNLQLLDKFLVHIEQAELVPLICFTKQDLGTDNYTLQNMVQIKTLYEKIGYEVIITSSLTREGNVLLKQRLLDTISVFSGQSGVGKSSLLNAIIPGLALKTDKISDRLGRGKHTTRHVELIPLDQGGFVADTPGFSQLDFSTFDVEQLANSFPEFRHPSTRCKFRSCSHTHEPHCQVIVAKNEGFISPSRYEHYVHFVKSIQNNKEN